MSAAFQCDLCGSLFAVDDSVGCIRLDVHLIESIEDDCAHECEWKDVDLCKSCTDGLYPKIERALHDAPVREPNP